MALLRDPDQQITYDKCRFKVKLWEHEFRKKKGRPPSKYDIKEASTSVRNAYKIYYHMKTAVLQESLMNIEGFESDHDSEEIENSSINSNQMSVEESLAKLLGEDNESCSVEKPEMPTNTEKTWDSHISNKNNKADSKHGKNDVDKSVNLSFSQKLFEGSKSSKRLPRKSLSFTRKKSESQIQFLSQPDVSTSEFTNDSVLQSLTTENSLGNLNVKIVKPDVKVSSQPLNIIQNVLQNNCKEIRSLDSGWISRLTPEAIDFPDNAVENNVQSSEVTKTDYDSEDIIANSEDELEVSRSVIHVLKKRRTDSNEKLTASQNLVSVDTSHKRLDFSNIFNKSDEPKEILFGGDKSTEAQTSKKPKRKSNRTSKKIVNLEVLESESDEDPFRCDGEFSDPDFIATKETNAPESSCESSTVKVKKQPKKSTKTSKGKNKLETAVAEDDNETYELEYSIKPRIVTVPRIGDIKKVLHSKKRVPKPQAITENITIMNEKDQKSHSKLEEKIKAGKLNDNYVQLNLKKKIYVRGKKTMTFNKFKRQQWKNKKKALCGPDMDMGGCDGGTLTCFKCGGLGHFAQKCPVKGDTLLPLGVEEEDECPYPTLEEAAQLAKESVLVVRKSTLGDDKDQDEETDEIDDSQEEICDELLKDDADKLLLAESIRLENEIKKIDMQNYIDSTTYVKPYYDLNDEGTVIDTPQEVFETLELFGHTSFRPGQEKAIMRILSGKSTLVTLSTGSGKSLCYQLPAYLYSQKTSCISLIISPLVSLMEDQVTGIPAFLKAACLHTNQTKAQREKIMEAIVSGKLNILLVSPEAVVAGERASGFGSLLRRLPPIAFACIDEAHCVSQWSHNFRPSYLKICKVLRDRLGVTTVLGLTATATRATSDSIINHICVPDGREGIISDIPLPDNLHLTVSRDGQRDQALMHLLTSQRFSECKSIIVYCTRREECQRVAAFLRTSLKETADANNKKRKRFNDVAETYHAGMSASRRKTIQKAFMSGELRIVVATVAFGMGINKSDIRSVIHYNMPMSFESYVQEVGRSGRDGLPAHCHLFLDSQGKDENELRRHIYANSIDRHVIRKLLQKCFVPCSCKSTCPRHEVAFSIQETVQALDVPEENIETLLCYLELHPKRYVELLSHAYTTCKIISYAGSNQIKKAAKECPPLAMALALRKTAEEKDSNVFEFSVVEVASAMGWDSGICKHKLKNLEWTSENNQPKRSLLSVKFENLGFRLLAPGNLSDSDLDEALDSLYERIKEQEKTSLQQLHAVHTTLTSAATQSFRMCLEESTISDKELLLKEKIREYFENPNPLDSYSEVPSKPINEEQIVGDIRSLVCMYRDNTFTGRAVARIFHGIQSPNYPAVIWGRCKFWRTHISSDFNTICQIATREILRLR